MAPGLRKRSHGWFESKSTVSTANGVHHEGYDNHSPGWVRNAMDRLTAPNRQGQTSLVINKRLKAESLDTLGTTEWIGEVSSGPETGKGN
ncbi:unnamed protein product [Aspergillus oryzae]|nr:unnamed protein product [Aspergillus oryzae]GMF85689.1 unnamed protein product [Aspergillus oryzae]